MSNNVLVLTDLEFETEVQTSEKPILAYFWAIWCGPCKLVAPSVEALAASHADRLKVLKMEMDASPDAVKRCQVEGVPALRLFKNNEIVAVHEGAITKDGLIEWVETNI